MSDGNDDGKTCGYGTQEDDACGQNAGIGRAQLACDQPTDERCPCAVQTECRNEEAELGVICAKFTR